MGGKERMKCALRRLKILKFDRCIGLKESWYLEDSFAISVAPHPVVNNKSKDDHSWKGPGEFFPAPHLQTYKVRLQFS